MGLTTSGSIGARTARSLDDCVAEVRPSSRPASRFAATSWCSATAGRSPTPTDAQYLLDRVEGLDGFYGASSMERLPTELAITRQTRDFADLRMRR